MFYSWAAVARMREQKGLGAQAITATQLFALVSFSNCREGGRAAGGLPCAAPRLARTLLRAPVWQVTRTSKYK